MAVVDEHFSQFQRQFQRKKAHSHNKVPRPQASELWPLLRLRVVCQVSATPARGKYKLVREVDGVRASSPKWESKGKCSFGGVSVVKWEGKETPLEVGRFMEDF